jgi:leucyl/phenylalanyl-tRNA--protein transferase
MILYPDDFKFSKSLAQTIRSKKYYVRVDERFEDVINHCSSVKRKGQRGTWITGSIMEAYINLYQEGYAHSFETYLNEKLVGGLYGVSLGKVFFGESMFHFERDASKVALYYLVKVMKDWNFHFIDVQQSTSHLRSMGAVDIDRAVFLKILESSLQSPTRKGRWNCSFQ